MGWLKDPLVIFLLAGAAMFAVSIWWEDEDLNSTIHISDSDLARLADQWQLQMRRPPTAQELSGLVAQFVKEEVYYREALRLGLDTNDTIVRRRMVQKLTFLTEDVATAAPLSEQALQDYYAEHASAYVQPQRFSFRHVYFSKDRRDDAQSDARNALSVDEPRGDPFMLQREYALRSQREIGDLFGRGFAESLAQLVTGPSWQGPIESAYGWHLVKISAIADEYTQPYEQVAERVANDARQAVREQANERYFEDLKARYEIVYPPTPEA